VAAGLAFPGTKASRERRGPGGEARRRRPLLRPLRSAAELRREPPRPGVWALVADSCPAPGCAGEGHWRGRGRLGGCPGAWRAQAAAHFVRPALPPGAAPGLPSPRAASATVKPWGPPGVRLSLSPGGKDRDSVAVLWCWWTPNRSGVSSFRRRWDGPWA
jgi:hypothetical protein